MSKGKIQRALISVYDKTGIVDFARALVDEFGVEIISTGGTADLLRENKIPVTLVENITGFPEMMDGRVKTLHPKIHAAILADRDNPEHMRQLKEQGIEPIDMVVVNLYPFEKKVADPTCTFEQAIEMIDIGGPCLLRAAAKNHKYVLVISNVERYPFVLDWLRSNSMDQHRRELAENVFRLTNLYDTAIKRYFDLSDPGMRTTQGALYDLLSRWMPTAQDLRYGENPHQNSRRYVEICDHHNKLGEVNGPDFSYNNLVDGDAALDLCKELTRELGRAKILFAQQKKGKNDSTKNRFAPVANEELSRRKLPHWQIAGSTYFVTFNSAIGEFKPEERDIVMKAIRYWDGEKLDLHAAVVMKDHVHVLFTPRALPERRGEYYNLSDLLQSIKANSGRDISKKRGGIGQIWVRESFDRWIRNEKDFIEKWTYIYHNPVKEGLAPTTEEYPWWYGVEETPNPFTQDIQSQSDIENLRSHHKENLCDSPNKENLCDSPSKENLCFPPVVVFVKHTNACGVGLASDPTEAYRLAYLGDPHAAMGGILACNFDIKVDFAKTVMKTYDRFGKSADAGGFFIEVWIAPDFDNQAREVIRSMKKWGQRVRLLSVNDMMSSPDEHVLDYKSITGGMLVQTRDTVGLNEDQWKVTTKRQPTDEEMQDLRLAWLICKHTKSNAVTICKDNMLIGNGAGQMSRVMSCRIATWLAKENGHEEKLKGSAAASDAFFPFADGPHILIDAGVSAIIQPGGSKRDEETIAACNKRDVAMIFTGTRHFKH